MRTVHEQRRDHACPQCDAAFGSARDLSRHVRSVHEQRKDHACAQCKAAFGRASDLRRHVRKVHEQRAAALPMCISTCRKGFLVERTRTGFKYSWAFATLAEAKQELVCIANMDRAALTARMDELAKMAESAKAAVDGAVVAGTDEVSESLRGIVALAATGDDAGNAQIGVRFCAGCDGPTSGSAFVVSNEDEELFTFDDRRDGCMIAMNWQARGSSWAAKWKKWTHYSTAAARRTAMFALQVSTNAAGRMLVLLFTL